MSHRYPRSYSSGPRYLEDEDAPPSLITPYQSGTGTPEDEEEMAFLQRLEQMQQQRAAGESPELPEEDIPAVGPVDDDEPEYPPQAEEDAEDWLPAGQEPHEHPPAENEPPPHAWHPAIDEGDAEEPEGKMPTQSWPPPPPPAEQEMDEGHEHGAEDGPPPSRHRLWTPRTGVPSRLAPEHPTEQEPDRATWFRQQAVTAEDVQPSSWGSGLTVADNDNIRLLSDRSYKASKSARVGGPSLAVPPPGQQAPSTNPAPTPKASPDRVPPAAVPAPPPLPLPKDPKKADSRSVGQLGVGPSKTMRTITLYDGKDPRQKNARNGIVDAAGLEQAARAYAGNAKFAIDISQKGWQDRLKKLQDKNIIDRIMIFDHGWAGNQEFGNEVLKPESEAWKLISSSIKPHGDIVFMGCSVSAQEDHRLTGEHVDGKAYIDSFYLASGRRRPVIRAYNKKVHHAEDKNHLSDTPGEEYSTPSQ